MNTNANEKPAPSAASETQTAPFLIGERVVLRTICRADAPKLHRWINDPIATRYIVSGGYFPMGWQDELDWIDKIVRRKEGVINLGIEVADLGLIGLMGLRVGSWTDRTGGTGTMIGEADARGKGYGTEAKMMLLAHAFRRLNLRKVYSEVCERNVPSLKCQLRCGYREEGRLVADMFRDGSYCDRIILAATRESFEAAEKDGLEKRESAIESK